MITPKQHRQHRHKNNNILFLFCCVILFTTIFSSLYTTCNAFTTTMISTKAIPIRSTITTNYTPTTTHNAFNFITSSKVYTIRRNTPNDDNEIEEDNSSKNENNEEAEALRIKAEQLRQQIRELEEKLPRSTSSYKSNNNDEYIQIKGNTTTNDSTITKGKSLKNKRILVVGANGRLGSMVTRYLLRNHPEVKEVVASVHYVGQATTRGYGRLSYEVGAEDGIGTIGAAWSSEEERNASFEFSDEMKDYNLQNLRVVEVELLDPIQCMTITEEVDSVIWCATDFDGNRPKAIASLNAAFLFRAIASPSKGRVEIEGLTNILGGLKEAKQNKIRQSRLTGSGGNPDIDSFSGKNKNDPISFVLVSSSPAALSDFETPFGEFNGLKRQGEMIVRNDFPSLSHAILQMGKFDDNFVEESLDLFFDKSQDESIMTRDRGSDDDMYQKSRRKINRRDAARAAVNALLDDTLENTTAEVWTALRG